MTREMSKLPEHLRQSLIWDRGTEMVRYDKIQLEWPYRSISATRTRPGNGGTNEKTNRLLLHWLTKGTDLSRSAPPTCARIAASLNARPRPTLDMRTPAQAPDQLQITPAAHDRCLDRLTSRPLGIPWTR